MDKKPHYAVLDWLRAIAILLVPLTHASYNEVFNANKIVAYFDVFAHLSVPIFIFLSGYLSLNLTAAKLTERLPRILIPYTIMSIICQVIKFRSDIAGNLITILYNILTGDSFGIYYFVFVIIYLYLFALVLNKYQKYLPHIFGIILLVSIPFYLYSTIESNALYYVSRELYYRFPLNWLTFFVAGMWFRKDDIFSKLARYKQYFTVGFLFSAVMLVVAGELGFWVIYGSMFWFVASSFAIVSGYLTLEHHQPPRFITYLSEVSFSIYLLHIFPLAMLYYFITITDATIVTYSLPLTIALAIGVTLFSIVVRETAKFIFKDKSSYLVGS